MADLKTQRHDGDVDTFLDSVEDPQTRRDARALLEIMRRITGEEPAMWGPSMVGFGSYHYRYKSGHEGDWFLTGFSPRKQNLAVYILAGLTRFEELLARLGRHKTGKSCLYLKRLDDVDLAVLEELIEASVAHLKATYPEP